ncbi:hypothetical protein NQ314_003047 [Rhamnusium bicolor]|uniref:DDE-1 domain-containing protein n=1 Tax=Rhamnusium bicolor TaxID=1586634 RepID=A0AAV8ZQ63_9CUCU|nr:hypothetical protein NQ314_003047 [Rhamnusium bicolor]
MSTIGHIPIRQTTKVVVDSMPEDWVLGISDTGWMQSSVFFEYVANDFDKWLENNKIKRPVILFIDGHKSHMILEFSKICEEKKIVLYALPPNTTHMLQPADVSVFRSLKQEWRNTVKKWQSRLEDVNSTVNKTNFCILLNETLKNTKMEKDIISGFRKCGLYPRDPNKVDYTKCIQNQRENINMNKEQYPKEENAKSSITSEDIITTKKVITEIQNVLESYGANVNIIFTELEFF